MGELYTLCRAAETFGARPSDLGVCSPDQDPVFMLAYTRTKAQMGMIESWERQRDLDAEKRKMNAQTSKAKRKR